MGRCDRGNPAPALRPLNSGRTTPLFPYPSNPSGEVITGRDRWSSLIDVCLWHECEVLKHDADVRCQCEPTQADVPGTAGVNSKHLRRAHRAYQVELVISVHLGGRVLEHLALLRGAEVRDHLKDRQRRAAERCRPACRLAGGSRTCSDLDRKAQRYRGSTVGPVRPSNGCRRCIPSQRSDRDVVTGASGREGALPSLMAFVRRWASPSTRPIMP